MEENQEKNENTKEIVQKKIKQWPFVVTAAIIVGFIAAICVEKMLS